MSAMDDNPDQAFITELLRSGAFPRAFDVNPFSRELRIAVENVTGAGELSLSAKFDHRFVQGRGVVAGGMVAALLDFALTVCAFPLLGEGRSLATTTLNISYLRPVLPGRVIAEATTDRLGRRAGFTRGSLMDDAGKLLATASAAVTVVGAEASG